MQLNKTQTTATRWILMTVLLGGCDDRVARVGQEAADRQAQQNTAMAELNKEVAGGTRQLVEADAQARKEIIGVHRDFQAERTRLDTGWEDLESQRRHMAADRRAARPHRPSAPRALPSASARWLQR